MSNGKVQGLGDHDLGHLLLDGKKFDARLDGSTTQAGLQRTIDGASTLTVTVDDPERFLQGGRYYVRRADLNFDDLWFRMAGEGKTGDAFALTFEDREIAMLRDKTKPRKMSRAKVTRAEFLQALVFEVPHIGFVCPELHKKQPHAPYTKQDQQTLSQQRARGIAPGDKSIKIKGISATRGQIQNLNTALNTAEQLGAGTLATEAMVCSGIGESSWRDVMNGNQVPVGSFVADPGGPWAPTSGYGGVLQGQVSGHSNNWFAKMDSLTRTTEEVKSFLIGGRGYQGGGAIKIAKANPHMDPGQIATTIEGGGAPASFYGKYLPEAKVIIAAYGGVDSVASSDAGAGLAYVKSYEFSRGAPAGPKGEDTWASGRRLADEIQWRWFMVAGVVYFISDADLVKSQPRMVISETTPGVDNIDYAIDHSQKFPSTVTIDCRAKKWAAPPGTVVILDPSMGPIAGTWLVGTIDRPDITDEKTTITLADIQPALKEPASQVVLRTAKLSKDGGLITGGAGSSNPSIVPLNPTSTVAKAYAKAKAIDAKHYPYIFGGGHGTAGVPTTGVYGSGSVGYDCSGAVCAVLAAGGIMEVSPFANGTVVTAQDLTRYGSPGKGKYITVYAIDEGGGNGHCFMEFTLPSGTVFFEFHHTGTIGGFEKSRDTGGFAVRHWPGT